MSQCKHIEDLIIKRAVAPVTDQEEAVISEHLSGCPACAAFEQKISTVTAFNCKADIKPRRDMKSSLLRRMRRRAHSHNLDGLIKLFTLRPSFFQAAVAAMLLFLIILSVPYVRKPSRTAPREYKVAKIDSCLNIINLHQIIQIVDSQKVGMSLREDTVLAKIIYTL